jgi:hypothetical protein
VRVFRYRLGPLLITVILGWALPCLGYAWVFPDEYHSGEIAAALSPVIALIIRAIYAIRVDAESLSCHNFWGFNSRVAWRDVTRVRPFSVLSFQYLRVERDAGLTLWMPTLVDDADGLRASLRELTPPNPVRAYWLGETEATGETTPSGRSS